MYQLLVSDIDGTLIEGSNIVAKPVIEAVNKLVDKGRHFAIATGRLYPGGRLIFDQFGCDGYLVACNGAIVKHVGTDEIVDHTPIPKALAKTVITTLKSFGVYFHIYTENGMVSEKFDHTLAAYAKGLKFIPGSENFTIEIVHDIMTIFDRENVYKIGCKYDGSAESEKVVDALKAISGTEVVQSHATLFDVMVEGVSKGEGIKHLAEKLGFTIEEVVAVGDNANDMEMLQTAGLGVAMMNANDDVKAVADEVTDHVNDFGVKTLIEKYFL